MKATLGLLLILLQVHSKYALQKLGKHSYFHITFSNSKVTWVPELGYQVNKMVNDHFEAKRDRILNLNRPQKITAPSQQ